MMFLGLQDDNLQFGVLGAPGNGFGALQGPPQKVFGVWGDFGSQQDLNDAYACLFVGL